MSKSYLGRAVIECGRGRKGSYSSSDPARRRLLFDEDGEAQPISWKPDISLRDNLRPLERWLKAHVGQPWDKVYSEFCEKEDKRTLRGDHIHRHFKEMVTGAGGEETSGERFGLSGYWGFFVDDYGMLQYKRRDYKPVAPDPRFLELRDWMGERKLYPTPDGHRPYRWGRKMHRRALDWENPQRDRSGRIISLIPYWGWGEPISDYEWGKLNMYPRYMWGSFILGSWDTKKF